MREGQTRGGRTAERSSNGCYVSRGAKKILCAQKTPLRTGRSYPDARNRRLYHSLPIILGSARDRKPRSFLLCFWPQTQAFPRQLSDADLGNVRLSRASHQPDHMGSVDLNFRRIFNDKDPLFVIVRKSHGPAGHPRERKGMA